MERVRLIDHIEEVTGIKIGKLNREDLIKTLSEQPNLIDDLRQRLLRVEKMEEDREAIVALFQRVSEIIPLRPLISSSISREKWKRWIESHPSKELRESLNYLYSKGYLERIFRHISQEEFEDALSLTIKKFKAKIRDLPFVLLIPATRNRSFKWVYRLTEQEWIGRRTCRGTRYLTKYLSENRKIRNIVILDDASYSGQQLSSWIKATIKGLESQGLLSININTVFPYMGKRAVKEIKRIKQKNKRHRILSFYKEEIEDTSSVLSEISGLEKDKRAEGIPDHVAKFKNYLEKMGEIGPNKEPSACFWFDHKIADDIGLYKILFGNKDVPPLMYYSIFDQMMIPPYGEGYIRWAFERIL